LGFAAFSLGKLIQLAARVPSTDGVNHVAFGKADSTAESRQKPNGFQSARMAGLLPPLE
jgi:hypothetical protein